MPRMGEDGGKACHWITDSETGERVLIPGCSGTAYHESETYCTCIEWENPPTIEQLEKRLAHIKRKGEEILRDAAENARMIADIDRRMRKLTPKAPQ